MEADGLLEKLEKEFTKRYGRDLDRVVTLKAPEDFVKDMIRCARRLGISRSELVRLAVYKFLRDNGCCILHSQRAASAIKNRIIIG